MSGFEWFLLIVVVILVPLVVAIAITLWTLEQARARKRQNRDVSVDGEPVKRRATRDVAVTETAVVGVASSEGIASGVDEPRISKVGGQGDDAGSSDATPQAGDSLDGGDSDIGGGDSSTGSDS